MWALPTSILIETFVKNQEFYATSLGAHYCYTLSWGTYPPSFSIILVIVLEQKSKITKTHKNSFLKKSVVTSWTNLNLEPLRNVPMPFKSNYPGSFGDEDFLRFLPKYDRQIVQKKWKNHWWSITIWTRIVGTKNELKNS